MFCSRREFALLCSAFAAQSGVKKPELLPTTAFRFEDLAVRDAGPIRLFQIFTGTTHSGFLIDMHESELAAGQKPHEAHRHGHEELVLIREGTLEFAVAGRKTELGPGSGAYVAANEEHGFRNSGTTTAKYFVLALGSD